MRSQGNLLVLLLGIQGWEMEVVRTALLLSQGRVRAYAWTTDRQGGKPDLLVVDGGRAGALEALGSVDPWGAAPVVFLGRGDPRWARSVLVARPLVPTRLLAALDDLTHRFVHVAPERVIGAEASRDEVSMHSLPNRR